MTTSGTTDFNLEFTEIAEEAWERAGREMRSGYDLRTARRSMNLMTIEWQNRGINMWTIDEGTINLIQGTNTYDLSGDTTGATFRATVFEASMKCEDATGVPATIVYASTALMTAIGGWESFYPAPYSVQNVSGVATASTLQVNVSGLRVVRAKWLDTLNSRHAIVTNGEAARWIEDGPRLAQAENVGQLGRDIAIYGYGVTAAFLPAGIVRVLQP